MLGRGDYRTARFNGRKNKNTYVQDLPDDLETDQKEKEKNKKMGIIITISYSDKSIGHRVDGNGPKGTLITHGFNRHMSHFSTPLNHRSNRLDLTSHIIRYWWLGTRRSLHVYELE